MMNFLCPGYKKNYDRGNRKKFGILSGQIFKNWLKIDEIAQMKKRMKQKSEMQKSCGKLPS